MTGDALLVRISSVALFASLFAVTAMAGEEPIQLKQATGLDKVETNCGGCHSLDYVIMNSPFPTGGIWEAEVNKMIKAFGAPIAEPDAKVILDYLKENYGR
jgi:sulfite dehydrogenase (cytochrome) subunit B